MKPEKKNQKKIVQQGNRDHPEQYPTDNESLFDRFESERTVDPIPVEDLNIEQEEEKQKESTKHTSSSERKYRRGV
jgi:hypothetical protein